VLAPLGIVSRRPVTLAWPLPTEQTLLGRMAGENFPVASRLLGCRLRSRLMALYGWARLVDHLGDEYPGDRLAALDWVDAELSRALDDPALGVHPLVGRAAAVVQDVGADPELLRDLIRANRIDQDTTTTYRSFEDLLGYCRWSANPVGRLVLAVFSASDPPRLAWSDSVCTALQIIEHCYDVAEDAAAGRVYLPAEDLARFGVEATDLAPAGPEIRALIAFQSARARRILADGEPLVASLAGRARIAVAGFVAGGHAALDALGGAGFDPVAAAGSGRSVATVIHGVRLWAPKRAPA